MLPSEDKEKNVSKNKKKAGLWLFVEDYRDGKDLDMLDIQEVIGNYYAKVYSLDIINVYRVRCPEEGILHCGETHKMFEDVKNNRISALVFLKLDRLARSVEDIITLANYCKKFSVELISISENIGYSGDPTIDRMANVIAAVDKMETEMLHGIYRPHIEEGLPY